MTDLVDTVRKQIDARLNELRPIVEEAAGLEAALNALQGMDGVAARRAPASGAAPHGDVEGRPWPPARPVTGADHRIRARAPRLHGGRRGRALGRSATSVSTQLTQLAKAGALTKAERGYAAP